ncbi:GntR family transcriptional regulator [Sphingomonas sp. VDB2]|uniref:GntR family transcriptional regulator n=1 Tax=Sphingomonas sp. VDB2 TaxID=3228751 RepID=UPI003A80EA3A
MESQDTLSIAYWGSALDRLDSPEILQSPATRRQAVAAALRSRIVAGVIPPGTLLRETALAQDLNVSATPVREALAMLAAEGLVEVETHRLKRATPIDLHVTRDLIRVQAELWRLGYNWGMARIGATEIAALERAIARYRAAVESGEYMAAVMAGLDFHTIFIKASESRELLRSTLDRRGLIARFIFLHGIATLRENGLRQHEAILQAFLAGDRDGVLACLDRMAARLIGLCDSQAGSDGNQDQHQKD